MSSRTAEEILQKVRDDHLIAAKAADEVKKKENESEAEYRQRVRDFFEMQRDKLKGNRREDLALRLSKMVTDDIEKILLNRNTKELKWIEQEKMVEKFIEKIKNVNYETIAAEKAAKKAATSRKRSNPKKVERYLINKKLSPIMF